MTGKVRIRRQCLTLTVLLLSSISGASAADDNNNNNNNKKNARRGRTKGQGRAGQAGQAPPQPGDLSTIDEANRMLVAGVEIPSAVDPSEDAEKSTMIRGMLYHYEPILPPYNGRYLEEELPPVPVPASSNSEIEEKNNDNDDGGDDDNGDGVDDAIVAAKTDSSDELASDLKPEQGGDLNAGGELDEESSSTVQDDESKPEVVPENDDNADNANDDDSNVDAATVGEAVDKPADEIEDTGDGQKESDAAASEKVATSEDGADEASTTEDSNDDDTDVPHAADDLADETASSLADDIVDAAMLLDDGAIEAIAEEIGEGEPETDIDSSAAAMDEESMTSSVDDLDNNNTISESDEHLELLSEEEKEQEQRNDSEDTMAGGIEDEDVENVAETISDQDTEDETADDDESQPPTVSEVESPKASDNSYVTAEKSTLPQGHGRGSDSSSASMNATSLAESNSSAVKELPETDDAKPEENTPLTTDDAEDGPAADGDNEKAMIDNDDRSTVTVGIDIESDYPSAVLKEGTADARRIAEEKGVPTNIENSDPPSPSDANATNDNDLLAEDAPAYGDDSDVTEEKIAGSSHNESMLVTRQDDEPTAPNIEKDHETWRGVYDRELGDKENMKEDTEPTNTADGTKRTDVDTLDNVREYIASEGEEMSGSIPSEAMSSHEDDAVADEGDAENEGLRGDTPGGISSDGVFSSDIESDIDGPSEGLATEEISGTGSMDAVAEEDPAAIQSEEQMVDRSPNEDAEISSEDSIDMNDLPDISSLRNSFSSSDVNSNFIDGIDDLDKFLEEVDTPDELDVAHGSSMQEVLVGKGVQILVKKVNAVVRQVKHFASKVMYRVGNSMVAAKIREGIESSGIIALGEKVREASHISGHKEKVAGIGQKVGQVFDEKLDAMNKFFEDLMENDIAQSASKIVERIKANSVIRRIISTLGLSDEDEDDDDMMDFSSFSRTQQQGSGSGAESSLEDRLAAMRQMY